MEILLLSKWDGKKNFLKKVEPLLVTGWDQRRFYENCSEKVEALLVTGFFYEVTAELDQLALVSPAKESEN